jgi:hypothetical protein
MAIKAEVLKALASYLATATSVPVFPRQADVDAKAVYPYITLLPGAFSFDSFPADEIDETADAASTLVCVGDIAGQVEIRVCSTYAAQREVLEDKVARAFMREPLRPGNLNLVIAPFAIDGVTFPNNLTASVDLNEDQTWDEEMVFTAPRFSSLNVDVMFSALVAATYYTIETLQLAITNDLESDTPAVETVTIDEDGGITAA